MRLLAGTATDADGRRFDIAASSQRTLLKFGDGTFAVRDGFYRAANGPYVVFGPDKRLTVSITGHAYPGFDDSTMYDYKTFRKSDLMLPNTCIECAEHVLKCVHANAHSVGILGNGVGARVSMSIGDRSHDVDEDDMNESAFANFPHGLVGARDATLEGIEPGDGMALVYSRNPARRGKKWTVHAAAVLMKSVWVWDRFVVVSEVFAPDDDKDAEMTMDWGLSCYLDAQDFKDAYFQVMPPSHYTLWKLSAARR